MSVHRKLTELKGQKLFEHLLNIVTNTTNALTAPVGTIDDNDKNNGRVS